MQIDISILFLGFDCFPAFPDDEDFNRSRNLTAEVAFNAALALNQNPDDLIGRRIRRARYFSDARCDSQQHDSCSMRQTADAQPANPAEDWVDALCEDLLSEVAANPNVLR